MGRVGKVGGKTKHGGPRPYSGRKKGTPNKATADARAAIAMFVDGNAHRLQGWLDRIADGDPGDEESGIDPTAGNPLKAFELVQAILEYHVPKLARTEMTGKDGADLVPRAIHVHFPSAKG